ncbi:hypothetical protein [uncultured Nostoc sp.]|uniref:hypothetical protein n=1 Tax=uncultured Nostoc sp. TaxID=340711 RepID=UPI0035C9546D
MKTKFKQLLVVIVLASASLGFTSRVNAEFSEINIPQVAIPDTTGLRNGGLALELCKRYVNQASISPNSLELQQIALDCQGVQTEYTQCIILNPPENSLLCTAAASKYLENLLRYTSYLQ